MKSVKKILAFLMVLVMAFSACVTVSAATKATSLKLNAATIRWIPGRSASFRATVTPSNASKTLKWTSSNPKVATVTSAGKLTSKAIGTTIITCATTDGSNLKVTCKVTVGKPVTSVKLNAATIKWPVGKSASFKATVAPSNAINKTLTWTSSNPKVATISQTGKLTSVGVGTTTITCKAKDGSGKYATCKVTVTKNTTRATSLKLNCKTINWPTGKTGTFKATVTPANASNILKWTSSNPKVATISQNGKLTAVSAGKTTITCATTDGSNLRVTCAVTVNIGVKSVKLNVTKLTWIPGRTGTFTATVSPANAKNKTLVWTSSNPDVASISSTGKIKTLKVGTTTITCKAKDGSGKYATCLVNVVKAVGSVTLPKTANIKTGETTALTANVLPKDAYNKNLTWTSSDTSVATVSQTGVVKGITYGTATITAKAKDVSGKYATCVVTVEPEKDVYIPVESVSLNAKTINWQPGKSGSFKATVSPSFATNKALVWSSSNEDVATISSTGKLTAVSTGVAIITCKSVDDETKTATCIVTVRGSVESIRFEVGEIKLFKGKTATLSPIVEPELAYNKEVTWESSDTRIVTVSSSGVVTAKAKGTATITCTAKDGSGKTASCKVIVGSKLTGLALSADSYTLEKGKTGAFTPELTPSDAITTLSWKSLNPTVATVDGNGKITAKQAGTATIVCQSADGTNKVVYGYVLVTDSSNSATRYNKYFKNYFSDGAYTINGITTKEVEGMVFEVDIKYGVNELTTKVRMDLELDLKELLGLPYVVEASMVMKEDGLYMSIPSFGYYNKVEDSDATTFKLFDNLVFKGTSTEKIGNVTYNVESFSPYGVDGLMKFYFDGSGTLKCINQVKSDGTGMFISDVTVSGEYKASDYDISK